jgi:hypothetical protein
MPRITWRTVFSGHFIREGDRIPNGYGIAYYEAERDAAVIMPIPLNLIVGAWRSFKWHLKCPPWRMTELKAKQRAYQEGYKQGLVDSRGLPNGSHLLRRETSLYDRR